MTSSLVLCEGAARPNGLDFDQVFKLRHGGRSPNLRIRIENITQPILRDLRPRARDLVRIASYVYGADTSIRRWSPKDVFADRWPRGIHLVIPVLDHGYWRQPETLELLKDCVEFLTGDSIEFTFGPGTTAQSQIYLEIPKGTTSQADVVTLFSGGIDSLASVVEQVVVEGLKPVLVSHRSTSLIDSRQKRIVSLLRERFPQWSFPLVSIWVNRQAERAVEHSQRSRAFLYLSLAAAVAIELGLREIRICDNGIVSLNLPRSGQNIGTLVTKSTHPLFLSRFEALIRHVFGSDCRVVNPYILRTKMEVVQSLSTSGRPELIQETVSCSRTEGMTSLQPHCGTCSQCIDRRFATIAAGVEDHDLPQRYEKDIFTSPLTEGDERSYAESYCRFAVEVDRLSEDEFPVRFAEIQDLVGILPGEADAVTRSIIDLHKRHASTVLGVMKRKYDLHWKDFVGGRLPSTSLISMLGRLDHLRDDKAGMADRLGMLIGQEIPKVFKRRKPQHENELQDAVEAVLSAAWENFKREVPQLPFGAVTTKPDFAKLSDPLYIEMKLVNNRNDLRRVTTEITSRSVIYRAQGALPLFVVYDPNRVITDDDSFCRDLSQGDLVRIRVIR